MRRVCRAGWARAGVVVLELGLGICALGPATLCLAQENPLDNAQTPAAPPAPKTPEEK